VLLAVEPAARASFDPASLYARLTDQLARYMLPAYVVVCDELPRTPTQKVQKTGLIDSIDLSAAWRPPRRPRSGAEKG
jgi:crotonobetaine/carnitine-CoA ligase